MVLNTFAGCEAMSIPIGYRREEFGAHPPNTHSAYAGTEKRAPAQHPVRLVHTLSEITGPYAT